MGASRTTRRSFLRGSAGALLAPGFLPGLSLSSPRPERRRCLVLVELFGGVDGLSVLVPHTQDIYYRSRPTLAYPRESLLRVTDDLGFPSHHEGLHQLFQEGRCRIVQGAGYPNSSRSHFSARTVWGAGYPNHSPRADGWIARLRDHLWADDSRPETITHVGPVLAPALQSSVRPALCFDRPEGLDWIAPPAGGGGMTRGEDGEEEMPEVLRELRGKQSHAERLAPELRRIVTGYEPTVPYPQTDFGQHLRSIAAMIQSGFPSRVYSVQHRSFDKHSPRFGRGEQVAIEFDRAMLAFLRDLQGTSAFDETLVLCHSEFGRVLKENSARGSDHGAAGLMFLFGNRLEGGLAGRMPSLTELDPNRALVPNVDFRRVYAAVIESWFETPHEPVMLESLDVEGLV